MTTRRRTDSLSRRHVLGGVTAVGLGAPVLAACGGESASESTAGDAPSGPTIRCGCHGSIFSAVDGAVLGGPATSGPGLRVRLGAGPGHRGRRSGGRVDGRRARGQRYRLPGAEGRGDPAGARRLQGLHRRLHPPGVPGPAWSRMNHPTESLARSDPESEQRPSRRIVFQGLSALGVAAVLAGCGGEESQPRATEPSPTDDSPSLDAEQAQQVEAQQAGEGPQGRQGAANASGVDRRDPRRRRHHPHRRRGS